MARAFEASQGDVVALLVPAGDVQRLQGTEPDEQARQECAERVLFGCGQASPRGCGHGRGVTGEGFGDRHRVPDRRQRFGVDPAQVVGDGDQGGEQRPAGRRDVDAREADRSCGGAVVPAYVAQGLLEPDGDRCREVGGEVVVRSPAVGPGVEGEAFAEAVLEGQDGEAAAFDQEPQDAPAHHGELADEVGVFAEGDHAGTAEDVAQRFQVVQGRCRVEVGEPDGMAAEPVGERCAVGRIRHAGLFREGNSEGQAGTHRCGGVDAATRRRRLSAHGHVSCRWEGRPGTRVGRRPPSTRRRRPSRSAVVPAADHAGTTYPPATRTGRPRVSVRTTVRS
ncbi:hypothetical protein ACVWXU_002802 [Streptomyces sp. TE33382]